MKPSIFVRVLLLILGLIGMLVVLPFVGMEWIDPRLIFSSQPNEQAVIFWQLRLPRYLAAVLAGAGLAMCGVVFQAMFRNALATPFTLGTASGASFGASVYIWSGLGFTWLGVSGLTFFTFAGALLALSLVYFISKLKDALSSYTMLLAGVATSIFFSSLILLMQYLADQAHSLRIMRWLMGGFEIVGYRQLLEPMPIILLGIGWLLLKPMELNLLSTGEELAIARGMSVSRTKLQILLVCGTMVGAIVAIAGPVGFVGLMVPHCCRLLVGSDHRYLLPVTLISGAVFLPLCDMLARVLIAPAELPVGIITAMLGGPFFIWILVRKRVR